MPTSPESSGTLVSFRVVFGLALCIRLLLVAFAEWQDANSMFLLIPASFSSLLYSISTDLE